MLKADTLESQFDVKVEYIVFSGVDNFSECERGKADASQVSWMLSTDEAMCGLL
jgi:hypothetical protein